MEMTARTMNSMMSAAPACAEASSYAVMGAIIMASIIIFNSIIIRGMIALLVLDLISIIVLLAITGKLNQPKGWA